ncbi:STAS domain-containing protein [Bacillus solimangrovi]|uniref:Anti-sigma factor antagonist n=1 Tax=Bacillus solimangrovi TaxID=1305675 RepID=A0A1E5LG74_9BACI|nr:STAS domain-containing protein [Bacillus solimangrovi]OEH93072.1 anti-anti-sigma factor [Bacillus solimangrovi]
MNLKVEVTENGLLKEVKIYGEVDAFTAPKLRESLIPLTEESGASISVDLSNVNYMDSTGLGVFIGSLKSSHHHGSSLKLYGMTARVERLFEITGLMDIMNIESSARGGTK